MGFIDRLMYVLGYEKLTKPSTVEDKCECVHSEETRSSNEVDEKDINAELDACMDYVSYFGPYEDMLRIHNNISNWVIDISPKVKSTLTEDDVLNKLGDTINKLMQSHTDLYDSAYNDASVPSVLLENPECLTMVKHLSDLIVNPDCLKTIKHLSDSMDADDIQVNKIIKINKLLQMQIECNKLAAKCNNVIYEALTVTMKPDK